MRDDFDVEAVDTNDLVSEAVKAELYARRLRDKVVQHDDLTTRYLQDLSVALAENIDIKDLP